MVIILVKGDLALSLKKFLLLFSTLQLSFKKVCLCELWLTCDWYSSGIYIKIYTCTEFWLCVECTRWTGETDSPVAYNLLSVMHYSYLKKYYNILWLRSLENNIFLKQLTCIAFFKKQVWSFALDNCPSLIALHFDYTFTFSCCVYIKDYVRILNYMSLLKCYFPNTSNYYKSAWFLTEEILLHSTAFLIYFAIFVLYFISFVGLCDYLLLKLLQTYEHKNDWFKTWNLASDYT